MSDQENFLTRWSRRKLEPAERKTADEPHAADAERAEGAGGKTAPPGEAPEFDISTLPSLDSIGANSDIRAFLQAGVPSALRHAALRRAWSADPAIRDYIGPNENFWEGVGMDNVSGFGALDPGIDVKKLVAEVFGDAEPAPSADDSAPAQANVPAAANRELPPSETEKQLAQNNNSLLRRDQDIAPQYDHPQQDSAVAKPRRHGGAMPL